MTSRLFFPTNLTQITRNLLVVTLRNKQVTFLLASRLAAGICRVTRYSVLLLSSSAMKLASWANSLARTICSLRRRRLRVIIASLHHKHQRVQRIVWAVHPSELRFDSRVTCPRSIAAFVCEVPMTSRRRWRRPWGTTCPRSGRVSPAWAAGGAVAAPARTSASGAPERSASPPRAASPGSAAPTARGLERRSRRSRISQIRRKMRKTDSKSKNFLHQFRCRNWIDAVSIPQEN